MSARHDEGTHRLTIDEIAAISASLAAALAEAMTASRLQTFPSASS
jgi:hypothetical protein